MFDVIQNAKARRFNFSSVFMDESSNDAEPSFKPKPAAYPKPTGKAYIVYQTTLPVLPIRYVSQQNGRHSSVQGRGSSSNRPRTPTHQILFPSPSPGPTNYPQTTYQFQATAGSLLPPPVPTQNYQQTLQPQTPASFSGRSPQSSYLSQGNAGDRSYFLSSTEHTSAGPGQYDPRSFLSQSTADPYNLPPPPPPPPPPTNWKPMFPSSTADSRPPSSPVAGSADYYKSGGEYTTQEKEGSGRYKRQAGAEEEEVESVCRTQMQFISPKVALNDKAEWKFIVNLGERDPRLKQIIKVDVCS